MAKQIQDLQQIQIFLVMETLRNHSKWSYFTLLTTSYTLPETN